MGNKRKVPDQTLIRLSYYLRAINYFLNKNKEVISSKEFADFLNISSHQLRKDLSYFGQFGRKGVGYNLRFLKKKIQDILGLNRTWNACVVGFGNLAKAISFYKGFKEQGVVIKTAFDIDKKKQNRNYAEVKVFPLDKMREVIKRENIKIGIITVPEGEAQKIAERLMRYGIKAILNFAPVKLNLPSYMIIKDVDLSCQFSCLTYHLKNK